MFKLSALVAGLLALSSVAFAQTITPTTQLPAASTPLAGSELVPCVQGGVTKKCLAASLMPAYVPAAAFGVSTASSDNSAALQAIDTAGKVGVLQPGIYKIASTVAFSHSQTGLVCASNGGFAVNTNGTPLQYPGNGCWLLWTGPTGGTMMTIAAPIGSTSNGRLKGNIVKGINFDGNNASAANGLLNYSVVYGTYDTLTFWNLSGGKAFSLDIVAVNSLSTPTNFGDPGASQFNIVRNVFVGPFNNEVGLYTFYASFDTIQNYVTEENGGADGMDIVGSDNMHLFNIVNYQTGTGYGLRFKAANLLGVSFPSNSNTVWGYSGSNSNSIYADGQTTLPGCIAWNVGNLVNNGCTGQNTVYQIDKANNVPDPHVEPGANLIWTNNDGTKGGTQMNSGLAIGDTYANQIAAAAAVTTEGLHIRNNNTNHIVLDNSGGASSWTVKLDSSGGANANLILQSTGTGQVAVNQLQLNTIAGGPGNAPTTNTGTCAGVSTVTGGGVAGSFQTTAACSGQIKLTFPVAAPHGWVCDAHDVTNTGVTLSQVGIGTTTACSLQVLGTATGTSDSIIYRATAY